MEKKLSDYIVQIKNVIPEDKHDQFLKLLDDKVFKFNTAKVAGNRGSFIDKEIRQTEWCPLFTVGENKMTYVHWANYFQRLFKESIEEYSFLVKKSITCAVQDVQILKYPIGGHYTTHVDHGFFTPRTLSLVYLVNEDYKEGQFNFVCGDKKYEVEVEKNKLVIFPSTFLYTHGVNPVTEGTKFSVVSWAL